MNASQLPLAGMHYLKYYLAQAPPVAAPPPAKTLASVPWKI
jgi:hypothetical protein